MTKIYVENKEISRPPFLGGGHWELQDLNTVTVLFGKNGSGKSLLLRSWRDSDTDNTHYVSPERGGELAYDPGQIQHQLNSTQRSRQTTRNMTPNYRQQVIARITAYFSARGDIRDSSIPSGDPMELERLLSVLLPDFSFSISGLSTPPFELTRLDSGEIIDSVQKLSSGEAQLLTLGLDILTIAAIWEIQKLDTRILLLDEPDAHLHLDLQARLAEFVTHVADQFDLQVVVATHSPAFLSALGQFGSSSTSVIYLDRIRDTYKARPIDKVAKELASCLGGPSSHGATLWCASTLG